MNDDTLRPRFSIEKRRIEKKDSPDPLDEFAPQKILYVDLDEEITQVFDRVKRCHQERIALVVPRRAVILQSIVNLKILENKIKQLHKEALIITADPIGLTRAQNAGFYVTSRLFEKKLSNRNESSGRPLLRGERPVRVGGEKISIAEVITARKPVGFFNLLERMRQLLKKRKHAATKTRIVFVAPNKQALFTLVLVSIFLLLAIAYIALPGATITLTPRATVFDNTFNVTFIDQASGAVPDPGRSPHIVLPGVIIDPPPFTKTVAYSATGKISTGQRATGTITIINKSPNPWDLAAKTRFQTDEGVIFRISQAVRVPPARAGEPGTIDVSVSADELDSNNQVIGIRGNIPPTRFFLPGLKQEESRRKLYAESKQPMIGGSTSVVKTVTKDDVAAAEKQLQDEIVRDAPDALKQFLEQQNLVQKTNLSLLVDRSILSVGQSVISIPPDLVGTQVDTFELSATYTARSLAFDRQVLVDALRDRLLNRVDPDKRIVKISDDDLSFKYLDGDLHAGRIRLTITMRALQVYDIDPERENGRRFLKKVADHILGMRVEAAVEYLRQQTDEIADVEITTWPLWAPTIPTIEENIRFEVNEE